MELKDKVRQRKQERIRAIQRRDTDVVFKADRQYNEAYEPVRDPREHEGMQSDKRWEDPEFVWFQKERQNRVGSILRSKREIPSEDRVWNPMPTRNSIWQKLVFSGLLFAVLWLLFQSQHPWAEKGKQFVRAALTDELDFSALAAWYQDKFSGAPSFIPSFHNTKGEETKKVDARLQKSFSLPVHGIISSSFNSNHKDMLLQTAENAVVYAMDTGRVIYLGNREDTGLTLIIQHANGYQSTYGMLQPLKWERNDWIKGGEAIGKASSEPGQHKGRLYFAIMKENEYINPADVVAFD